MTPSISVIIPAYNAALYLAATLESILAQTRDYWECIIVDDGSTDDTAAVASTFAERDARFSVVRQQNAGVSAARNMGFARSTPKTKYVIFLDADDVWEPTALQDLSDALNEQPEAVGSCGLARYIGADGIPLEYDYMSFGRERYGYEDGKVVRLRPDQPTNFTSFLIRFSMIPPGTVLLRRSIIEKAGEWNSHLSLAEDWEMFGRMSRWGAYVFLDRCVVSYRKHNSNATVPLAQNTKMRLGISLAVRRTLMFSPHNTAEQRQLAVAANQAWTKRLMTQRQQSAMQSFRQRQWKGSIRDLLFIGFYALSLCAVSMEALLRPRRPL